MKLRESDMPPQGYWEALFQVPLILDRLEINNRLRDVVEVGCGYGTFTLPVARRITGKLTTCDIDLAMVARVLQRVDDAGLCNVKCSVRDVVSEGFGVQLGSQSACLLFNILHCEEPVRLLAEAAEILEPDGVVLVVHWRYDEATPRGPRMEIRPRPEQIQKWAAETGLLEPSPIIDLPPWHYGLRLRHKPSTKQGKGIT